MALQTLKQAFTTDVTPILATARLRAGGAIDPIAAYRSSGYRRQAAERRPAGGALERGDRLMIRKAFRMSVHTGQRGGIRSAGTIRSGRSSPTRSPRTACSNYSIFLDRQTGDLFAYAEIESEERWEAIAATDVCRRWWRYMRELMPSKPDGEPVSRPLREVFHL